MIPYIETGYILLGPLALEPYGVLALSGLVGGCLAGAALNRRRGAPVWPFAAMLGLLLFVAWPAAHVIYLVVYQPEALTNPARLVQFWAGASSMGFLPAVTAAALALSLTTRRWVWETLDGMAFGLAYGWTLGRLGCFLIHDHPGKQTDFFLGVQGICQSARRDIRAACHDLALYELLAVLAFVVAAFWLIRSRRIGWIAVALPLMYAPVRFAIEFLQGAAAVRWVGLTPVQWFCIAILLVGFFGVFARLRASPASQASTA